MPNSHLFRNFATHYLQAKKLWQQSTHTSQSEQEYPHWMYCGLSTSHNLDMYDRGERPRQHSRTCKHHVQEEWRTHARHRHRCRHSGFNGRALSLFKVHKSIEDAPGSVGFAIRLLRKIRVRRLGAIRDWTRTAERNQALIW